MRRHGKPRGCTWSERCVGLNQVYAHLLKDYILYVNLTLWPKNLTDVPTVQARTRQDNEWSLSVKLKEIPPYTTHNTQLAGHRRMHTLGGYRIICRQRRMTMPIKTTQTILDWSHMKGYSPALCVWEGGMHALTLRIRRFVWGSYLSSAHKRSLERGRQQSSSLWNPPGVFVYVKHSSCFRDYIVVSFSFLSPPNPLTHTDNPHTPSEELTSSPPTHTQTHTHPSASESEDCLFTMCMKCILECIISLPYGGDCDRLTHQLHGYNDYSQRDNHFTEGWGNYCEILHLLSKLLEKKVPKGRDRVLPRTHFDQKNPFWVLP